MGVAIVNAGASARRNSVCARSVPGQAALVNNFSNGAEARRRAVIAARPSDHVGMQSVEPSRATHRDPANRLRMPPTRRVHAPLHMALANEACWNMRRKVSSPAVARSSATYRSPASRGDSVRPS